MYSCALTRVIRLGTENFVHIVADVSKAVAVSRLLSVVALTGGGGDAAQQTICFCARLVLVPNVKLRGSGSCNLA